MELSKEVAAKVAAYARRPEVAALHRMVRHNRIENYRRSLVLDLTNYKPYRNRFQKVDAELTAVRAINGTFYSNAPRSYHPPYQSAAQ